MGNRAEGVGGCWDARVEGGGLLEEKSGRIGVLWREGCRAASNPLAISNGKLSYVSYCFADFVQPGTLPFFYNRQKGTSVSAPAPCPLVRCFKVHQK